MAENVAILVNNEFLDLTDANIRFEKINSFFVTELFQGDYSFPFEAPVTPKNLRIFGFANNLDVSERITSYDAFLYLFGAPYLKTKLTLTKGRKRGISIVLSGGIKALKSAEMKLSEIPLGGTFTMGWSTADIITKATTISKVRDWKTYGFTFVPFYQPDFYDGKNADFVGVVNRMDPTNGNILCANSLVNGNPHTLVPWLFLFYVLQKIFEYEGLNPVGSFWENQEYQTLLLVNNYAIDGGFSDGNTKAIVTNTTANVFKDTNDRVEFKVGPDGTYDVNGSWENTGSPGSFYVIKKTGDYSIDVRLDLKLINGFPGRGVFALEYNFVEVARCEIDLRTPGPDLGAFYISHKFTAGAGDIGKPLLVCFYWENGGPTPNTSYFLEVLYGSYFSVVVDKPTNNLAEQFEFKNHVDDKTVGQFLAEVKKLGVNLDFDFQNSTVSLDAADDLLKYNPSLDLSKNAEPDYDLSLEDAGKGITISYEFKEEELVPDNLIQSQFKGEFISFETLPNAATINDWAIISTTNELFKVVVNAFNVKVWEFSGYNYNKYVIGQGESELAIKLAPVQMCIANNDGGTADQNKALMPRIYGKGSSPLFANGVNVAPMRLAFWRGQNRSTTTAPKGGNYILASSTTVCINGDEIGTVNFRLDKPNGIVRKTSERVYIAMNLGTLVEKIVNLKPLDLDKLKSFCKISIDYNIWLLKSASISISKKLIQAKLYLLKL
jgi:hypothetical protein